MGNYCTTRLEVLALIAYVEHRSGKLYCNVDAMSRKPRRFRGDWPFCGPTGPLRRRVSTLTQAEEDESLGNLWSAVAICQPQRIEDDIGAVLEQYLKEMKVCSTIQVMLTKDHAYQLGPLSAMTCRT